MRSRAVRAVALLASSVLPITVGLAQPENAETWADLEACAAIERSNARLACYDGVLGRPPSLQEPAVATAAPSPAATPAAAAVVPAAAAATAPAAVTSSTPPPVRTESDGEDSVARTIVVVEVRLRSPSDATFVTDDGQVWDQIDSGRGRYPEVPFEATLERGSFSSTFLVSPAGGPRIRITRRDD